MVKPRWPGLAWPFPRSAVLWLKSDSNGPGREGRGDRQLRNLTPRPAAMLENISQPSRQRAGGCPSIAVWLAAAGPAGAAGGRWMTGETSGCRDEGLKG